MPCATRVVVSGRSVRSGRVRRVRSGGSVGKFLRAALLTIDPPVSILSSLGIGGASVPAESRRSSELRCELHTLSVHQILAAIGRVSVKYFGHKAVDGTRSSVQDKNELGEAALEQGVFVERPSVGGMGMFQIRLQDNNIVENY